MPTAMPTADAARSSIMLRYRAMRLLSRCRTGSAQAEVPPSPGLTTLSLAELTESFSVLSEAAHGVELYRKK